MTIAQTKAARRKHLNDPRYAKLRRKDAVALSRREANKIAKQRAMQARKKPKS